MLCCHKLPFLPCHHQQHTTQPTLLCTQRKPLHKCQVPRVEFRVCRVSTSRIAKRLPATARSMTDEASNALARAPVLESAGDAAGGAGADAAPAVPGAAAELTATAALAADLAARRAQHEARAARFGMTSVGPVRDLTVLGAHRAAARRDGGFVTGFDVSAPDQAEKRRSRAERFARLEGERVAAGGEADVLPEAGAGPGGAVGGLAGAAPLGEGMNSSFRGEKPVVLAKVDPLENRRDVAIGEVVRQNVLHVFGVDDMSTEDIRKHFLEYGPSWIEWINDSSCNVTFEDDHTAMRVLTFMVPTVTRGESASDGLADPAVGGDRDVPDLPPDRMSDAEGAGANAAVAADGATELPDELVWRKLAPFTKKQRARDKLLPLWMRRATERDVRPERPNPRSRWARSVVGHRESAREKGRRRATARRDHAPLAVDAGEDDIAMAIAARRRGGRPARKERSERRRGAGTDGTGGGNADALRPEISRRLGVSRSGIAKARAKKPTLMDVDRALDSAR